MPLHTRTAHAALPKDKPYKIFDSGGLYIEVAVSGSKLWRWRYSIGGKTKVLALGSFPEISIADARALRDRHRLDLRDGIDPVAERRQAKAKSAAESSALFGDVVSEWLESRRRAAPSTLHSIGIHIRNFEHWHQRSIHDITAADVRSLVRKIEQSGRVETARRVLNRLGAIYRFALVAGITDKDPTRALLGYLPPKTPKPMAAITNPKQFGALLRAIDGYEGTIAVRTALQILPLIFCRPGELRNLKWADVDFDDALIRLGSGRTKQRREHLIPLSRQVVEHLRLLQRLALPSYEHVFVSDRRGKPFSDATLNAALRRMGYDNQTHVAHGFRSTASTLLSEQGFVPEVIELSLGHSVAGVRGVYMRSARLDDRRQMMQAWADYCDGLKGLR